MGEGRPTASLVTPPGKGGIAVVVLAGQGAERLAEGVFRPNAGAPGRPGRLRLGKLMDGDDVLDEAIVRGEADRVEIHLHGGPVLVRRLLELLADRGVEVKPPSADPAFDPAHPTWRNPAIGREMLELLPRARSLLAVAAISQQWSAGLSELTSSLHASLTGNAQSAISIAQSAALLRSAARRLAIMEKLLNPAEVVLAGPPNVGKSTLANALTGRATSVVHETPGATRDWVRELAFFHGVPVWLTDTAGLWDAAEAIDAEAVRRARHRIDAAEVVCLLEAGEPFHVPDWMHAKTLLRVASKCDVAPAMPHADVCLSARTGEGLDGLRRAALAAMGLGEIDPAAPMAFTRRQANLLAAAADALDRQHTPAALDAMDRLLRRQW